MTMPRQLMALDALVAIAIALAGCASAPPDTTSSTPQSASPTPTDGAQGTSSPSPIETPTPTVTEQAVASNVVRFGTSLFAPSPSSRPAIVFEDVLPGFALVRTIEVLSSATITITSVSIAPIRGAGAFSVLDDSCTGTTVEPGKRCAIEVVFEPADEEQHRAELVIGLAPDFEWRPVYLDGPRMTGGGLPLDDQDFLDPRPPVSE